MCHIVIYKFMQLFAKVQAWKPKNDLFPLSIVWEMNYNMASFIFLFMASCYRSMSPVMKELHQSQAGRWDSLAILKPMISLGDVALTALRRRCMEFWKWQELIWRNSILHGKFFCLNFVNYCNWPQYVKLQNSFPELDFLLSS